MKAARYELAEITWRDSVQLDGGDWTLTVDLELRAGDLLQRSAGYVVAETADALVLARSISEWLEDAPEKVEGVLVVPKAAIVDRRRR